MSNECWSYGPESDWCGEHDSPLNIIDPNDPELLICQFVASGFGHHEDLAKLERKQTADYLRGMACAPGQEWTGSGYGLAKDHGHTTCWHLHRAADWLDPASDGGARTHER